MRQKIYKILIVMILIFIIINTYIFHKNIKQREETKSSEILEVSTESVEDSVLEKQKNIYSKISDWNLILVNKNNPISDDYKFETIEIEDNLKVDIRIKDALEKMLADARNEGLKPKICSAYRTTSYQKKLFNNKIKEYQRKGYSQIDAEEQASYWVTIPGTSEHEIGLAVDIVSEANQTLDEKQENTEVQKWLMVHCYEYGFILRYPTDKKDITKINYEPWHYRYVGVDNAMLIKEKGFCLEEYIEFLNKYE